MTEEDLRVRICEEVAKAGSLRALGKKWGVSAMYLCDLRMGRRIAGLRILNILGLERIVTIRKAVGK